MSQDKTARILKEMLTENTGQHFLDSGGAADRHWQKNAVRDFDSEPRATLRFDTYRRSDGVVEPQIEVTLNVYPWLLARLDYDAELDTIFHGRFLKERKERGEDSHWFPLMDEFPEYLSGLGWDGISDAGEPDGEERECDEYERRFEFRGPAWGGPPVTINTYNEESLLSQVLQYTLFTDESNGQGYVALQIHGGADVRGGYTAPRIFTCNHVDDMAITDSKRAHIFCTAEYLPSADAYFERLKNQLPLPGIYGGAAEPDDCNGWYTDDACHWYADEAGSSLEKFAVVDLDDDEHEYLDAEGNEFWRPGKLVIRNGEGFCPHCGGKLSVVA